MVGREEGEEVGAEEVRACVNVADAGADAEAAVEKADEEEARTEGKVDEGAREVRDGDGEDDNDDEANDDIGAADKAEEGTTRVPSEEEEGEGEGGRKSRVEGDLRGWEGVGCVGAVRVGEDEDEKWLMTSD